VGTVLARYLRQNARWFAGHVLAQGTALVLSVAAFVTVVAHLVLTEGSHFDTPHKVVGGVFLVAVLFQTLLGAAAHHTFDAGRDSAPLVDRVHWWLGRLVLAGGFVSILLGFGSFFDIVETNDEFPLWFLLTTSSLSVVGGLFFLEFRRRRNARAPPRELELASATQFDDALLATLQAVPLMAPGAAIVAEGAATDRDVCVITVALALAVSLLVAAVSSASADGMCMHAPTVGSMHGMTPPRT
jgi:hypothetical protein